MKLREPLGVSVAHPLHHRLVMKGIDPVLHGSVARPSTDWAATFEQLQADAEFGLASDQVEAPAA
jgi:hypothetical protein